MNQFKYKIQIVLVELRILILLLWLWLFEERGTHKLLVLHVVVQRNVTKKYTIMKK